ncbi:MAG: YheV family putative metal-binding protein [Porticoccaceae bacterium]|nr:YheV family putative metal-binding protein [Porticoccaceae bacterium]
MTVVKRFIAGAVCPRCAAMDRIVMYSENGKQFRECVSCGYRDEMLLQSSPRELDTRVNRSEEERRDEVRPVKLIDPKAV